MAATLYNSTVAYVFHKPINIYLFVCLSIVNKHMVINCILNLYKSQQNDTIKSETSLIGIPLYEPNDNVIISLCICAAVLNQTQLSCHHAGWHSAKAVATCSTSHLHPSFCSARPQRVLHTCPLPWHQHWSGICCWHCTADQVCLRQCHTSDGRQVEGRRKSSLRGQTEWHEM